MKMCGKMKMMCGTSTKNAKNSKRGSCILVSTAVFCGELFGALLPTVSGETKVGVRTTGEVPTPRAVEKEEVLVNYHGEAQEDHDHSDNLYRNSAGAMPISETNKTTYDITETSPVSLSRVVTGLSAGVHYQMQVSAENELGEADRSPTVFTTEASVPSSPGEVQIEGSSFLAWPPSFTITWEPSWDGGSAVYNYELAVSRASVDQEPQIISMGGSANAPWNLLYNPSCTVPGWNLVPNVMYKVKVRALNSIGTSAYSAHRLFRVFKASSILLGYRVFKADYRKDASGSEFGDSVYTDVQPGAGRPDFALEPTQLTPMGYVTNSFVGNFHKSKVAVRTNKGTTETPEQLIKADPTASVFTATPTVPAQAESSALASIGVGAVVTATFGVVLLMVMVVGLLRVLLMTKLVPDCLICYEQQAEYFCSPCGHILCCSDCKPRFETMVHVKGCFVCKHKPAQLRRLYGTETAGGSITVARVRHGMHDFMLRLASAVVRAPARSAGHTVGATTWAIRQLRQRMFGANSRTEINADNRDQGGDYDAGAGRTWPMTEVHDPANYVVELWWPEDGEGDATFGIRATT